MSLPQFGDGLMFKLFSDPPIIGQDMQPEVFIMEVISILRANSTHHKCTRLESTSRNTSKRESCGARVEWSGHRTDCAGLYNQHKQESHGGLPHHQTPFVPHVFRYELSKALGKPCDDVI